MSAAHLALGRATGEEQLAEPLDVGRGASAGGACVEAAHVASIDHDPPSVVPVSELQTDVVPHLERLSGDRPGTGEEREAAQARTDGLAAPGVDEEPGLPVSEERGSDDPANLEHGRRHPDERHRKLGERVQGGSGIRPIH